MNVRKFLGTGLLIFVLVVFNNSLALAYRHCTQQDEHEHGEIIIVTDCSSEYDTTRWTPFAFSVWLTTLMDTVQLGLQNLQGKLEAIQSAQVHARQLVANMWEKERETMDSLNSKRQEQEFQAENLKEQEQIQMQQQQALMQDLSFKK